jgi:hypothetical protein
MIHLRPEPMDPELDRLLDAERGATAPPAALDRIWARVSGGVPPTDPSEGEGGGATVGASISSKVVGIAIAAFVAGGVTGAAIHAAMRAPARERIVYVDRPVPLAPPAPIDSPPPAASTIAPSSAAASASAAHRAHATSAIAPPARSSTPSTLSAERALLDSARAALTSGDTERALALLDDHVRRFPKPQLAEEREAIAIQALVAAGRYDEARARAARFRASAPTSLFLPAVDATIASIP